MEGARNWLPKFGDLDEKKGIKIQHRPGFEEIEERDLEEYRVEKEKKWG